MLFAQVLLGPSDQQAELFEDLVVGLPVEALLKAGSWRFRGSYKWGYRIS